MAVIETISSSGIYDERRVTLDASDLADREEALRQLRPMPLTRYVTTGQGDRVIVSAIDLITCKEILIDWVADRCSYAATMAMMKNHFPGWTYLGSDAPADGCTEF